MLSGAFAGHSPSRSRPQDWGKLAERSVARTEKEGPSWPSPLTYDASFAAILPATTRAQMPKVGREAVVIGSVSQEGFPGPGDFDPLLLPSGKEFSLADLNGAERMKSAAFTSLCDARASPQQWARANFITPNKALHDSREWLGPGSHEPTYYDSMDAICGMTAYAQRQVRHAHAQHALQLRARPSWQASPMLPGGARSVPPRARGARPMARTATAPGRLAASAY